MNISNVSMDTEGAEAGMAASFVTFTLLFLLPGVHRILTNSEWKGAGMCRVVQLDLSHGIVFSLYSPRTEFGRQGPRRTSYLLIPCLS